MAPLRSSAAVFLSTRKRANSERLSVSAPLDIHTSAAHEVWHSAAAHFSGVAAGGAQGGQRSGAHLQCRLLDIPRAAPIATPVMPDATSTRRDDMSCTCCCVFILTGRAVSVVLACQSGRQVTPGRQLAPPPGLPMFICASRLTLRLGHTHYYKYF